MKVIDEIRYFPTQEIAEKLGLHEETIRRYIRTEKLKARKIGSAYHISEEELREFLKIN